MSNLYALKITVTNFCGYKCKYCYVDTYNTDVINESFLYKCIDFYMNQKGKEKIIFFLGGESLLEFDILQKGIIYARNKERETHKELTLFITTSGLSITRNKILFFINNNVKIGVSIDGNEHVHGINRVSRGGINTYQNTIGSINLLNEYYDDRNLGYALTVDENTVKYLLKSFIFLSTLDEKSRNITIAGTYKDNWRKYNIAILEKGINDICELILKKINNKEFYYYNVLSFFILQNIKGNILKEGNIEIHVFPDGEVSLHLFSQSIFSNKFNDPTKGRFNYINKFAQKIIKLSKKNINYSYYIKTLRNKPIL